MRAWSVSIRLHAGPFFTFVKKVMEYFCSGCFFLQNDISYNDFLQKELIDISSYIFRAKLIFNQSEKSFKLGWRKPICHIWFVTRSEIYYFVLYMACWGMIFPKKKIPVFFLFFSHLPFLCYYCSIDLKMQSEHSGLHPDTSSLVPLYFWSTYHKPSKFEQYSSSNLLNRLLINLVILTWTFSFNFKSIWIKGICTCDRFRHPIYDGPDTIKDLIILSDQSVADIADNFTVRGYEEEKENNKNNVSPISCIYTHNRNSRSQCHDSAMSAVMFLVWTNRGM